jgi:hypothetical protein
LPGHVQFAQKAGLCRRTVADALRRLKDLGLLHWQRRSKPGSGEAFKLVQDTNAYAVQSPANWQGYYEPPPAPPPEPGTWGDHPPRDPVAEALDELRHGQQRSMLDILEADPGDELAGALARLGRAMFGRQA